MLIRIILGKGRIYNKVILCILPAILILFSCILAFPEENDPVVSLSENEPTPVPLEEVAATGTFDLPDTPTPVLTPTPTEGAQTSIEPTGADVIVYWQQDPERQVLYRTNVDQFGRAVSKSFAIEASANYKVLRPDHQGGSVSVYDGVLLYVHPSPNGKLAALASGWDGLNLYNFASGEIYPLIREGSVSQADFSDWSGDSRFVLVRRGGGLIWLVDVERGSFQELGDVIGGAGAVSPDGSQVIFTKDVWGDENVETEVWLIDIATRQEQLLYQVKGDIRNMTWSPDGQFIAYDGDCTDKTAILTEGLKGAYLDQSGLCVMQPDGTNHRLLSSSSIDTYPKWDPNSRYLVFVTISTSLNEINEEPFQGASIYVIDAMTGEERRLLAADGDSGHIDPAWSPNGSQIVFASNRSGQAEIWRINVDGTGLQQVTFDGDGRLKRLPIWGRQ